MRRKKENNMYETENTQFHEEGTTGQRYYARHPEYVQDGCRECGNPAYPDCKDSCPLFDD